LQKLYQRRTLIPYKLRPENPRLRQSWHISCAKARRLHDAHKPGGRLLYQVPRPSPQHPLQQSGNKKDATAAEIREIAGCVGLLVTDSRKFRFRFAEMKNPLCAEIVFPAIFFQEGISSFTCRY
jgi:hypothetical protein